MTKNIRIEDTTRTQIAEFLPEAIRLAVRSYRNFMNTEEDINEKGQIVTRGFVEHHKSAKIAISHIELLIKLAKWADLPDATLAGSEDMELFASLMATAEAELNSYQEEEEDK